MAHIKMDSIRVMDACVRKLHEHGFSIDTELKKGEPVTIWPKDVGLQELYVVCEIGGLSSYCVKEMKGIALDSYEYKILKDYL